MPAPAIEIQGLRKRGAGGVALHGIDLAVRPGERVGLVGPSSSGKTSLLRALAGLDGVFDGDATVAGVDPREEPVEVKRRVGFVPEDGPLYDALRVSETLLFIGRLHGLDDGAIRSRVEPLLEVLDLARLLGRSVGELGGVARRKLLLAMALVHDPPVLLLDEPFHDLDAASAVTVKEVLAALARRGRACLLATRAVAAAEGACDRFAVIFGGKIAAFGTAEQLRKATGAATLEAGCAALAPAGQTPTDAARAADALAR